jgi:hypothetical protein
MSRLPAQQISIPSPAREASAIVIARLEQLGADAWKMGHNPMGVEICRAWTQGEFTDAQFDRAIGNLLILNPKLRLEAL